MTGKASAVLSGVVLSVALFLTITLFFPAGASFPVHSGVAYAQNYQGNVNGDACNDPNYRKLTAVIAFSSATTTAVVPLSATRKITVCEWLITMSSGTTPTLLFKYGTHVTNDCDTGASSLTGVMALPTTSGTEVSSNAGLEQFVAPAGNQLCITAGGTTPTFNGYLVYALQ